MGRYAGQICRAAQLVQGRWEGQEWPQRMTSVDLYIGVALVSVPGSECMESQSKSTLKKYNYVFKLSNIDP